MRQNKISIAEQILVVDGQNLQRERFNEHIQNLFISIYPFKYFQEFVRLDSSCRNPWGRSLFVDVVDAGPICERHCADGRNRLLYPISPPHADDLNIPFNQQLPQEVRITYVPQLGLEANASQRAGIGSCDLLFGQVVVDVIDPVLLHSPTFLVERGQVFPEELHFRMLGKQVTEVRAAGSSLEEQNDRLTRRPALGVLSLLHGITCEAWILP